MYIHKAYLNAPGGPTVLNLTHDVKRCLADSKQNSGHINILSAQGTTSVILLENDPQLQKEYLNYVAGLFKPTSDAPARRSRTSANGYHHMAAFVGLSLTLSFEQGRLLCSAFHDIVALDFEPRAGRREFVLSVIGDAQGASCKK